MIAGISRQYGEIGLNRNTKSSSLGSCGLGYGYQADRVQLETEEPPVRKEDWLRFSQPWRYACACRLLIFCAIPNVVLKSMRSGYAQTVVDGERL